MTQNVHSLPVEIEKKIQDIATDNRHGSAYLAQQSIATVQQFLHLTTASSLKHLKIQIANLTKMLIQAQPAMAAIIRFGNQLVQEMESKNTLSQIKERIDLFCKDFQKQLNYSDKAISNHAVNIIQRKMTLLTHSYSSTVYHTLINAQEKYGQIQVTCTESRPLCEGVQLAQALAEQNISVSLIVDSALFSQLQWVDAVLIGADAITNEGVINKIGSQGLALAAYQHHIPVYVLCSTQKFLPPSYKLDLYELKNPTEISSGISDDIVVKNYYFDITSFSHISGIVTEEGVLSVKDVRSRINALSLHPSLM